MPESSKAFWRALYALPPPVDRGRVWLPNTFGATCVQYNASDDDLFNDIKCLNHSIICTAVCRPNVSKCECSQTGGVAFRRKNWNENMVEFCPTPKTGTGLGHPCHIGSAVPEHILLFIDDGITLAVIILKQYYLNAY